MSELHTQIEAFARWFALRAKPRTVKEYTRGIKRLATRAGIGDVRAVTRDALVGALAAMPPTKLRTNDYLAMLAFCRWAATEARLIPSPLIEGIQLARPPERAKARTMRPFTEAEVRRLIAVAEEDERAVRPRCRVMARTPVVRSHLYAVMSVVGGRWREMCGQDGVRWGDVDFDSKAITFRSESSKGRRTDVVPLLPIAVDALTRWRALNAEAPASAPVWPRVIRLDCLRSDMKAAGIPARVNGQPAGWHSFRHGLGARLAEKVAPTIAAKVLRHRDLRMTTQVYAQVETERVRKAIAEVDGTGGENPSGNLSPKMERFPLTQGLRRAINNGEPEQASPLSAGMGVTGLEPVPPISDAGSDLMAIAEMLSAAASRLVKIAFRLQQEHGDDRLSKPSQASGNYPPV